MIKKLLPKPLFFVFIILIFLSCNRGSKTEISGYDQPDAAMTFEIKKKRDLTTGKIPKDQLLLAYEKARLSKITAVNFPETILSGTWTERGPNSDVVGPSNGNTRANSGVTSGRVRAVLVDAADATGKTVFAAGVDGGLWKTTDITLSPATWTLVNDFLSNMSISFICQDPSNNNTMYMCTGEGYFNGDAVQGVGVFKSTDHGVNWTLLASTSTYTSCTRILCDAAGRVYLGTNGSGILRSADGGSTWTNITPTSSSSRIADMELSSTGRLHITTGLGTSTIGMYRYTDNPSTVAAGTWTSATTPFTYPSGANCRVELGCSGNTLYALPSNTSARVTTVYKSTDGGANWAAVTFTATNQNDFNGTNSPAQAWYCLAVDIDPSNSNNVIIGNLNCLKTTDGGTTWSKMSEWVGTAGQYVHADQHLIKWYDNGNKLIIACDGGIHYSSDKGVTIRDRNTGLRIKQFYSGELHPSTTNYMIGGTQDNGTHVINAAGLASSTEVTGGDGAFVAIDQNQSTYHYGAYVFNRYRRSTDNGTSWGGVNFFNTSSQDFGQFINPWDYDNTANIIYASSDPGEFLRWTTPQTTASGNYFEGSWPASVSRVPLTALGTNNVSAVHVSPYTSNRVYFGGDAGKVVYLDAANTATTPATPTAAGVDITGVSFPVGGYVSCVATGSNDQNLIVTFSNYGVNNVWVTTNGGTSWTAIDGDLPNMPVNWAMFGPNDNTKVILATEAGVWVTMLVNGGSTNWTASPTFPTVRTDMLNYRSSDGLVLAATHGRGMWTQAYLSIIPVNDFTLRGRWMSSSSVELNWDFTANTTGNILDVETSTNGVDYVKVGSLPQNSSGKYSFIHTPTASAPYYRVKSTGISGLVKYSNTIKLFKNGNNTGLDISKVFPNPVKDELKVAFSVILPGKVYYSLTNTAGQEIWRREEDLLFTGSYIKQWQLRGIPSGNYKLTITQNGERKTTTVVKQ